MFNSVDINRNMGIFNGFFLLQILTICHGFLHSYPGISYGINEEGDAGEALFLTPYIESGNVEEGRRLARVPLTDDIGIESYSGYFTVNKTYNSNQFFWYFPPSNCKQSCNVVLWLQGGPGASSLIGLFDENGPIKLAYNTIEKRLENWAYEYHMIYIDNPVGTGFSFTEDPKGYSTGQVQIGEELYSSVVQFLQLFPDLQGNKFYITGESYAGKYIPALAYTIHKKNPDAKIKVNLKGAAIGNGLCDPINQVGLYAEYYKQLGIFDFRQVKKFEELQNKLIDYIKQEKWYEAFVTFDEMIFGDLQNGFSVLLIYTGFFNKYNYLYSRDYLVDFGSFIQKNEVRKQIHVGHREFSDGYEVWRHLQEDYMKSVAPWIEELLEHYYIYFYNGQLDLVIPYPSTVNFLRNLNFTGAEEYKNAKKYVWFMNGNLLGYKKEAARLGEVMVRNAGHMVPTDQAFHSRVILDKLLMSKD